MDAAQFSGQPLVILNPAANRGNMHGYRALVRQRAEQAHRREDEARILYELVRDTTREENLAQQLSIIARSIVDIFASKGVVDCAVILPDATGRPVLEACARKPAGYDEVKGQAGRRERGLLPPDEAVTASWVLAQAQTAELHDVKLAPTGVNNPRVVVRSTRSVAHSTSDQHVRRYIRMVPILLGQRVVGVLRLSMEDDPKLLSAEQSLGVDRERTNERTAFFWAFVDQAAAVIERDRLRRENLQVEILQPSLIHIPEPTRLPTISYAVFCLKPI